jgi:hypothetical protein
VCVSVCFLVFVYVCVCVCVCACVCKTKMQTAAELHVAVSQTPVFRLHQDIHKLTSVHSINVVTVSTVSTLRINCLLFCPRGLLLTPVLCIVVYQIESNPVKTTSIYATPRL